MDSPCPSTPFDSRPVSPEGVMGCSDRVNSPAFVHSTPMQAGGLPLLQLEFKKLEMEKRLQYQEAERQRQFELARSRLELEDVPHIPSHVIAREEKAESRLIRSHKLRRLHVMSRRLDKKQNLSKLWQIQLKYEFFHLSCDQISNQGTATS